MNQKKGSTQLLGAGAGLFLLGLALWWSMGKREAAGQNENKWEQSENFASKSENAKSKNQGVEKTLVSQKESKSASFERMAADEAKSPFPTATPSIDPNVVLSPFPPYNLIDVTGAESGDDLYDPSTIPIDPDTGKPMRNQDGSFDVSKAKRFRVP